MVKELLKSIHLIKREKVYKTKKFLVLVRKTNMNEHNIKKSIYYKNENSFKLGTSENKNSHNNTSKH